MTKKVLAQVNFEIGQIDHLLESYAVVLEKAQVVEPDLVETTAVASVLHSFYNGLENIFLSIAKGVDSVVPNTPKWHRDLLTQMTKPTLSRGQVLTPETAQLLTEYVGFRHFYRHSYSFTLDWSEMQGLAASLDVVWNAAKSEVQAFLTDLASNGEHNEVE